MPKLMLFVRRKPGTTREDFRQHYENIHAPLALAHMTGLIGYRRNYSIAYPGQPEPPYDCVTEMWFADQEALATTTAWMRGEGAAMMAADEAQFMDRSSMTAFLVEEAGHAPDGNGK